MQVYLVGGAVRDGLLGLVVKDKDFVVVGATPEKLLSQGFQQVGADFPVFLHPKSHAEYALARQERKIGAGHKAFCVQSDTGVSLKDDLLRRDLTINALAIPVAGLFDESITGAVVDYYGGLQDLANKRLRHISPAFSEDPLRVLRVARFYAKFYALGFVICDDTKTLMQKIAKQGELASLSRERLWAESVKAMGQNNAFAYWQCLYELGILHYILPALADQWQKTAPIYAILNQNDKPVYWQFAMLMSAFFADDDPKVGIDACAKRLCVPKLCVKFAYLVAEFYQDFRTDVTAKRLFALIQKAYHSDHATVFWQVVQACYQYLYYYDGLSCDGFNNKSDDTASDGILIDDIGGGALGDDTASDGILNNNALNHNTLNHSALNNSTLNNRALDNHIVANGSASDDSVLISKELEKNTQAIPTKVVTQLNRAILAYHSVSYADVDSHLQGRQIGDAIDKLRLGRIQEVLG